MVRQEFSLCDYKSYPCRMVIGCVEARSRSNGWFATFLQQRQH